MAYNTNGPDNELVYSGQMLDVSTASVTYIPVARMGRVVDAWCTISAALTTADGVITVKKYPLGVVANAVTIGTITLVQANSAAGFSFQMVITGTEAAATVSAGDVIAMDGDGQCDTTSIGRFSVIVRG